MVKYSSAPGRNYKYEAKELSRLFRVPSSASVSVTCSLSRCMIIRKGSVPVERIEKQSINSLELGKTITNM